MVGGYWGVLTWSIHTLVSVMVDIVNVGVWCNSGLYPPKCVPLATYGTLSEGVGHVGGTWLGENILELGST